MFFCEYCEIFKNTFFHKTPLVAAVYVSFYSLSISGKSCFTRSMPLLFQILWPFEVQKKNKFDWKKCRKTSIDIHNFPNNTKAFYYLHSQNIFSACLKREWCNRVECNNATCGTYIYHQYFDCKILGSKVYISSSENSNKWNHQKQSSRGVL